VRERRGEHNLMSRIQSSNRARRVLAAALAPFLLLLTPFVAYLQYQRYGLWQPEVMIIVAVMAAVSLVLGAGSTLSSAFGAVTLAGLVTFLVDIQARGQPGLKRLGMLFLGLCVVMWVLRRHANRIVSLMMATVLALALLPSRSGAVTSQDISTPHGSPSQRSDQPLILHLLLDEFIGTEGLPMDLTPAGFKEELQSFFVDRGFRLFGKAYSEYPITQWSVPQLLNLAPGDFLPDLTSPGPSDGTYRLTRNAYFERLVSLGYGITVHEPDYLYLCPDGLPASCRTYPTRSLDVLNHLDVQLDARLSAVAGTFLWQSETYSRVKDKYRALRLKLESKVALPAWNWDKGPPGSATSMPMFDAVMDDLSKAQRGTLVFAHVLMPHYPYVYDEHCAERPRNEWLNRNDPDRADIRRGFNNVPETRAARYAAYFRQLACTERKIDELIEAIPAPLRHDAIIIVQGDHGSRISLVDPTTVAGVNPAVSDYADAFSTMFAVRSASIEAGYDVRTTPITCLLRTLVESDFRSTTGIDACSAPNIVYFMTGGKPPEPRPLPDFGGAPGSSPDFAKRASANATTPASPTAGPSH
jgi:hypothetical protein